MAIDEKGPGGTPGSATRQPDSILHSVSPVAGAVVAAVAAAHLLAWLAGMMTERGSGALTMKTNAAFCLLLLAASLLLLAHDNVGAFRRWSGRLLALVALAVGAMTLLENLVGWDLAIDQLLAREQPGALGVMAPNRMGSPASVSISLIGTALLLLSRRGPRSVSAVQGLAVIVCLVGLLPTIGYLYGVRWLYALERVTAIAWPTALSIITLGVGVLMARPTEGPIAQVTARDAGGVVFRRLLLPLLLLPIGFGWLQITGQRLGLFEPAMGSALVVLTFIVSLCALTWLAGRRGSRAAAALRRYELVVHESRDVLLFIRRSDGRILEANPAATAAYGYSHGELLSMSVHDLRAPDTRALIPADMTSADRGGVLFETVHQRKDGSTFPAEVSSRGALIGDEPVLVSVVRDITERKRVEHELREANERLREADERKNEFLAVLSHELRNPLAPIRSGLHVLERAEPGSDASRRAQEVIARQARQLTRLVDDLLDVVRVSRNKIRLRPTSFELNALVRRTVEDHRSLFDEGRISVETRLCSEPLPLRGDEARIAQVVGNLLHNASKFTPPGGRVVIRTSLLPGARASLQVMDTGVGIERTTLERLFVPFMQAETSLDRSRGGLGLGLALVKSLVAMHGGDVRASSEGNGQGAEFTVALPLEREAPAAAVAGPSSATPDARRVLVIEDNPDAGDTLKAMLELAGHIVRLARDGPEGLAVARGFRPDVVLCDIGLPEMDGFEVARAFRADEALRATTLVALSGYALREDVQRAREAGFDHHLAKPASPDAIERLIAQFPPAKPLQGETARLN